MEPKELTIDTVFNYKYIIPLYQRNYAWEESQVTQLVQDIWDYASYSKQSSYYIGSLIVNSNKTVEGNIYETIDGQQRLTTLNILMSVLKNEFSIDINTDYASQLRFASRPVSSDTLKKLSIGKYSSAKSNTRMDQAYLDIKRKISELLKEKKININEFSSYFLNKVKLLRVEVPKDTDLNHYFEIMNNRGEQLEKHEILKAELLLHLKEEPDISRAFSMIWDACSDMDKYMQYGFEPKYRDSIFGTKDWDAIPDDFLEFYSSVKSNFENSQPSDQFTFIELLKKENFKVIEKEEDDVDSENVRFNSIVTFPNFLLHVLRIQTSEDIPLDDKRLIDTFKDQLKGLKRKQAKEFVLNYGYALLKCRFLFDKYILKREYKGGSDKWSVQKIKFGKKNKYYVETFENNKHIEILLSMFHVSFPQMIYKHWLNAALNYLFTNYDGDLVECIDEEEYIIFLQKLCDAFYFDRFADKVIDYYKIIYTSDSNPQNDAINEENLNKGTDVQNYIFNRLDYILWKSVEIDDKKMFEVDKIDSFEFSFRSSVEHFFPRNPKNRDIENEVKTENLDLFGNLCLISRNKNSELSNYSPIAKTEHYDKSITVESLKQQLMMRICKLDGWDDEAILRHGKEMTLLLNQRL